MATNRPWACMPQQTFARLITEEIINLKSISKIKKVIDFPAGNGAVSSPLAETFPEIEYHCLDISNYEIAKLKAQKHPNVTAQTEDILDVREFQYQSDVWLLINSLFLFDDSDKLIKLLHSSKYQIVIIPNCKTKHFSHINQEQPKLNKKKYTVCETIQLFQKNDFELIKERPICFAPRVRSRLIWKVLKYATFLDRLNKIFKTPHYHLLVFRSQTR